MLNPIVIVGCTASGKSDLAEALAMRVGEGGKPASILAVDSMQVYRGMDIGTAKPSEETRRQIPHAMIDVADPWETYSAARFVAEGRPILEKHAMEDRPIILVGGTIFYLRALLEGLFAGPSANAALRHQLEKRAAERGAAALHGELAAVDPEAAARIHANDLRRIVRALEVHQLTGRRISDLQTQWNREHPAVQGQFIGVRRDKELLNSRINARVRAMLQPADGTPGLLEEVKRLAADPRGFSQEAASAVGYRQLLDHLAGKCSLDDAVEQIKIQTRHLAKLQRTWLKRFNNVRWLEPGETQSGRDLAEEAQRIIAENAQIAPARLNHALGNPG